MGIIAARKLNRKDSLFLALTWLMVTESMILDRILTKSPAWFFSRLMTSPIKFEKALSKVLMLNLMKVPYENDQYQQYLSSELLSPHILRAIASKNLSKLNMKHRYQEQ